ncbi:hypothetical protein C2845_PM06G16930 [Panicum miliaceum]|uniref:Uncharacterized protein n=1 Tax=Panicum miliaceum TaxID=4540 RepID=A0A3L6RE32_PANMI|nr:hypothetical protein C2845_PM06G16930 [Panicum miliaceum]
MRGTLPFRGTPSVWRPHVVTTRVVIGCESSPRAPARCRRPVGRLDRLLYVTPQASVRWDGGGEPCHVILVGRTVVLVELQSGQFEWVPVPVRGGPAWAKLVAYPRFRSASSYSSRARSIGPGGSLPFIGEKP